MLSPDNGRFWKRVRTSVIVACTVEKVVALYGLPFPFAFEKAAEIEAAVL